MFEDPTFWFVVFGLAGLAAVAQHFYDRFATNGLYNRSSRSAAQAVQSLNALPSQMGIELENAMDRFAVRQREAIGREAEAASKSLVMSGTRQIGIEKAQMREIQGLMVDGILGPAMQAIEAWNPEWAEKLRAVPPDLLLKFLESPWFIANIKPRIQPYLDKFLGSQPETASVSGNPFLKDVGT